MKTSDQSFGVPPSGGIRLGPPKGGTPNTRRAFFRALWFVAIGGVAAILLRRSCAGGCGGCPQFAGCGLPWKGARR
jgi:hypothetical protein